MMKFTKNLYQSGALLCSLPGSLPAGAASSTSTLISVSPSTYIDELASSRDLFPEVTLDDVLKELAQANVISIGETHAHGMERTYLVDFYNRLATTLNPKPAKCLVENYDVLLSTDDPVRAAFNQTCPAANVYNSVTSSNYTSHLSDALNQGTVLTHTGFRHVFPIALMYPAKDFPSPQWVDIPEHGTISKQLPDNFASSGSKMRGLAMRASDDLFMSRVVTDLQAITGPNVSDADLAKEADKVTDWATKLKFTPGQTARLFEVHRVNLSLPYAKSYVALLNRSDFDPSLVSRLLKSEPFKTMLQTTDPGDLTIGCFIPESPGETFSAGSVNIQESGTIYAYSTSLTTQHNIVVTISKSHDVQTENSTY